MKSRWINFVNLGLFLIFVIIGFSLLAATNSGLKASTKNYDVVFLTSAALSKLPDPYYQAANTVRWHEFSFFFLLLIPLTRLPNNFFFYGWNRGAVADQLMRINMGGGWKAQLFTAQICLEVLLPVMIIWIMVWTFADVLYLRRHRFLFKQVNYTFYQSLVGSEPPDLTQYLTEKSKPLASFK